MTIDNTEWFGQALGPPGPRGNHALAEDPVRPRIALVAFGRPTFDLEMARSLLGQSRAALEDLPVELVLSSDLLTSVDAAVAFGERLAKETLDAVICQFTTFVDARFVTAIASCGSWPIVFWSLREPGQAPGSRLLLNSLTGANMAAQQLRRMRRWRALVLANPGETALAERLMPLLAAAAVRRHLSEVSIAVLGSAPDGFTFSDPSPENLASIGVDVHFLDLERIFQDAAALEPTEAATIASRLKEQISGTDRVDSGQLDRAATLEAVVQSRLEALGATAAAVRCWPEFFTTYGAAACSLVSSLNERGIAAACEADILGSVTMDILHRLAGGPPYLGDLVEVNEQDNVVVFWHCGAGAFSLASPSTGAQAGVHPNRQLGLTLEFALRAGRVTIARLGEWSGGLRLLIAGGEVLDRPQRFLGTAATVRLDGPTGSALHTVERWIADGWEPHYALIYGDVRSELIALGSMLEIPTCLG